MLESKTVVFFDMDGLLFDTEKLYFETRRDVLKEYGVIFSIQDYIPYMGKSYEDTIDRLSQLLGSKEKGKKVFDEAMNAFNQRIESGNFEIKPGVLNLLEQLDQKDVRNYVVSSSATSMIEQSIQAKELSKYFTGYIGGDQVRRNKPLPDIYRLALKKANVPAKQALVFEDSRSGVQAASSAGVDVVAVPDVIEEDDFIRSKAAAIINKIDEVLLL